MSHNPVNSISLLSSSQSTRLQGKHIKSKIRVYIYSLTLSLDILGIFISSFAASTALSDIPSRDIDFRLATIISVIFSIIAFQRHCYSLEIFKSWRSSSRDATVSLALAAISVIFLSYVFDFPQTGSRSVFGTSILLSALWLIIIRRIIISIANEAFGASPIDRILIHDGTPAPTAAYVSAEALNLDPDIANPNALDRIGKVLNGHDRVVIACSPDRRTKWSAVFKGANIQGEIVVPELKELSSLGAGNCDGETTLIVSIPSLGMRSRALKRLFDLTFSGLALFIVAPVLLFTALAIKFESPGPILFVQPRLGRGNRLFNMYKFRSMRARDCDPSGAQSTLRNDSRVTVVGKFIRASSVDELPQLINVFRGEMSIVGPRPHALGSIAGDKLFWEIDARYWYRHAAKPGITGLAQVRGYRGATHLPKDLTNRLQADLDYLNGWSIWRDLSIIISTVKVLAHRNAY